MSVLRITGRLTSFQAYPGPDGLTVAVKYKQNGSDRLPPRDASDPQTEGILWLPNDGSSPGWHAVYEALLACYLNAHTLYAKCDVADFAGQPVGKLRFARVIYPYGV